MTRDSTRKREEQRVKLTKSLLEKLEPRPGKYTVWDALIVGFGVQVSAGGTKTFYIRYRIERERRMPAIGTFPAMTLDAARKKAQELLGQVASGRNPAEEKQQRRKNPTVSQLSDQFLDEYAPEHLKPKSAKSYKEMIEGAIKPGLGKIQVEALTTAQVARWHHGLKTTPRKANLAFAVLRKMLNLAATWGLREKPNPCTGIKPFPENKRDRVPTIEELGRLWEAIKKIEVEGIFPSATIACLKLILFTGSRKTVIRTLQWGYVDWDARLLRIPPSEESKADETITIALSEPALSILRSVPKRLGCPFVFPGMDGSKPTTTLDRAWFVIRERAELGDVRLHDLRHLFGTTAGALNLNGPMIQAALNHKTPAMTSRYINLKDSAKIEVADAVGAALDAMLYGKGERP